MRVADIDRFVVFDTETTGVDREECRIVTAYAGLMDRSGNLVASKNWIINPGIEIPQGSIDVHGITNEIAQEKGMTPAQGVQELYDLLTGRIARGYPVVAYNMSYDWTLLDRECRRHLNFGIPEDIAIHGIDPFIIDKAIDKWRKGKRQLTVTAAHYGVELVGAHDAEADAVATGRLAWAVLDKLLQKEPNLTTEQLHQRTVEWAAAQAADFQDYLRTKQDKPDAVIDGRWPLAPFGQVLAAA